MFFASDNAAPAHPAVLAALNEASVGFATGYGADDHTQRAETVVRDALDAPDAAVYFVPTGTAANALALSCLTPPWGAVYCHRQSHVEEDECGAVEFYSGGCKLALMDGAGAKILPADLDARLSAAGARGVHNVVAGAVSLTNATELGAVYSAAEIADICKTAARNQTPVHLDGARLANALCAANCTASEMTWKAGVDVLSFGGTKGGLLGTEAVVFFDPARAENFERRRKRGGHLLSKHRYLSVQISAFLENGLWLDLAETANAAAGELAVEMRNIAGIEILNSVDANMIFASFPRAAHKRLLASGAQYYLEPAGQADEGPDNETVSARLVCSWATTPEHIRDFVALLAAG